MKAYTFYLKFAYILGQFLPLSYLLLCFVIVLLYVVGPGYPGVYTNIYTFVLLLSCYML